MSDNKNSFGFDKELMSSLENLKKKYASYDDLEMDIQTNAPKEESAPVEYEIETGENTSEPQPNVSEYKIKQKRNTVKDEQDAEYVFSDSIKNKDDSDADENDFIFSGTKEDEPEEAADYGFSDDFNKKEEEQEPESNDIYSFSAPEEPEDDEENRGEDAYIYSEVPAENEEADEFADLDEDEEEESIKLFSGKKEKEQKAEKPEKAKKKSRLSKKALTIILAVAIPVLLWLTVFVTDMILVNQWYSPFFCIETAQYENGGRNYVGLFYKVQFKVDSNGDATGEIIPWGVKGPND